MSYLLVSSQSSFDTITAQYTDIDSTIIACSSGVGSAISIVRMSGPKSKFILEYLCQSEDFLKKLTPQVMHKAIMYNTQKNPLDHVCYCFYQNPKSYTGQDLVEIFCHGSVLIVSALLEVCQKQGARLALPGEFTFRAVTSGKLTWLQGQAVQELLSAQSTSGIHLALEKLSGLHNMLAENLKEKLTALIAAAEISIDFSDQDLPELSVDHLKLQLNPIDEILEKLETSFELGKKFDQGLNMSLIGKPNAGKSSLFNLLLGENRSIVSSIPGTTRDVVSEKITLKTKQGAVCVTCKDTAGLRDLDPTLLSDNLLSIEHQGIIRSLGSVKDADLIIIVLNLKEDQSVWLRDWSMICETLSKENIFLDPLKTTIVGTHIDCFSSQEAMMHVCDLFKKTFSLLGFSHHIPISNLLSLGITELSSCLSEQAEKVLLRKPNDLLLTRLDQLDAVKKARYFIKNAQANFELDLFASDLRQALNQLIPIIGGVGSEDILGYIFQNFCIGK